jgi:hypothetical protein
VLNERTTYWCQSVEDAIRDATSEGAR